MILGSLITDWVELRVAIENYKDRYEYGRLIMGIMERPIECPMCEYKFHYIWEPEEEEIQELIDIYLGE